MLLHECGHIYEQSNDSKAVVPWDLDLFAPVTKVDEKAPRSWYIAVVREEMVAWDVADALAREMAIKGLSRAMRRMRRKCLTTYIRWAAVRGDHTIGIPKKKRNDTR